jgi:hypothetical protein
VVLVSDRITSVDIVPRTYAGDRRTGRDHLSNQTVLVRELTLAERYVLSFHGPDVRAAFDADSSPMILDELLLFSGQAFTADL